MLPMPVMTAHVLAATVASSPPNEPVEWPLSDQQKLVSVGN